MQNINLEEILKVLNKNLPCEAVVIFGSYSRGDQNSESDIDIAVKLKKEISPKEIFSAKQKLEEIIQKDVDLINLDEVSLSFKYEILMTGNTIYSEDSLKFDLYKIDIFREYLDFNESRKSIVDRIKKGGTIYGK